MAEVESIDPDGPYVHNQPCQMTLIWPPSTADNVTKNFVVNISVHNGDYLRILDAIKLRGGVWAKDNTGGDCFLFWPPTVMRLKPI